MRTRTRFTFLLLFSIAALSIARGQSAPTAVQGFQLSAFGGATGTYTGLDGGKNLGITAGVDLGFRSFFRLHPAAEVRGTYAVDDGPIDGQKNFLAGLKVEKRFRRFNPYVDLLVGRGVIDFQGSGFLNPSHTYYYLDSPSTVISYGGGVDVDLTHHFAFKADAQLQHYDTPVTTSGSLYAKPITAAVIYRFDFNHHPRNR